MVQHDVVMDIDFDYCVRPTLAHGYADRSRLPSDMYVWLGADELVTWLKKNNLFHPGGFAGTVEGHEEVLMLLNALVEAGTVKTPFDLIHIDAHPDMMDLDSKVIRLFDEADSVTSTLFQHAKAGDFLQYAVRSGWINRLWMVFPDDEGERIAGLFAEGPSRASAIVNKPVEAIGRGQEGGVDLRVRIGDRLLDVSLHTRATLPALQRPVATVLAHSPQFVPPGADCEYRRLEKYLGGGPLC
jgi:hypothetical protein